MSRYGGGSAAGATKSRKSRRTLALPKRCVNSLRELRDWQDRERTAAGPRWHDSGLVFTTRYGTALSPANVRRDFRTGVPRTFRTADPYRIFTEDPAAAAAREVEEETGWRPSGRPELAMTFQPMIGNGDAPQDLYYVAGAEQVGRPDLNETSKIKWVALDDAGKMIERGEIVGAATVIGVLSARAKQHDRS